MSKKELIKNEDYIIDEFGRWIFTREYHFKRGYCCSPNKHPGCLNCPYREDIIKPQELKK